jgi:hypothetical protein
MPLSVKDGKAAVISKPGDLPVSIFVKAFGRKAEEF